jgi:hypothetical protein
MKRVLSPNGKLILVDASPFTPLRQLTNAVAVFAKEEKFSSTREISTLVKTSGLAISKCSRLDWMTYLMVAEKTGAA